jgi:Glycoside hydrolase family 44
MLAAPKTCLILISVLIASCGGSGADSGSGPSGISTSAPVVAANDPSAPTAPGSVAGTPAGAAPSTGSGTAPPAITPGPSPTTPPPIVPGTPPPSVPPSASPPPPAVTFYDESILSTWADSAWNGTVDFQSKAVPANSGAVSAKVSFSSAYGAFALANYNTPVQTAGYNAIAFSIRGSSSARFLELWVEATNGGARAATSIPDVPAGAWLDVVIYLADLGLPDSITRLGLSNDSKRMNYLNVTNPEYLTDFYVDNLRLIKAAGAPVPAAQAGPAITINTALARRAISPEIYGVNWENQAAFAAEIKTPINRWGGDATSRFNYATNNSNPGFNWYFANRNEALKPADFIAFNKKAGSNTIMTLPLIGWTAKDATSCGFSVAKYGAQSSTAFDRPDCGNGTNTAGAKITGNSAIDTSVAVTADYYKPWIQNLVQAYGRADQGGVKYYNLDNEPGIWSGTHRDVVASGVTHTEFLGRSIAAAKMLKSVDPSAKTLGPSEDGWTRYIISGADSDAGNYSARYDNLWAVEWYLKQMRDYEIANRQRLLDYLDLHYYPQAAGVYGAAGGKDLQALRLRSVRSLWDPTYVDESWISSSGTSSVKLIPRMRDWISTYYPGTKLAITEYNFGALNHINGALAQADVLGVFGREGVDIATLWGPPETYAPDTGLFANKPGAFAMRMYRNYDGAGAQFGDTSVQAVSADQDRLSVYAALDSSDGSLKLMVINKTDVPLTSNLKVQGYAAGSSIKVYRYGSANLSAIETDSATAVSAGAGAVSVVYTFAPNSITLLRLIQ